jgi:hypothetical protein
MNKQRLARATLPPWVGFIVVVACGAESVEQASNQSAIVEAVGTECVLADEAQSQFANYVHSEINVETNSPSCSGGVCIANQFAGRVSCPYGQAAGEGKCKTSSGEPVEVAVEPQLVSRSSADAVYCSCRCDGPPGGDFCECPSGTQCRPLIQDFGLDDEEVVGSYCLKVGTDVEDDWALGEGERCDESLGNCDDR